MDVDGGDGRWRLKDMGKSVDLFIFVVKEGGCRSSYRLSEKESQEEKTEAMP